MGISTWQDLPIQDERTTPYNLPNQINPVRGAATAFGLDVLNLVGTVSSLVQSQTAGIKEASDGLLSDLIQSSAPLSQADRDRVKQFYPNLLVGNEASREQVEAAIDRQDREQAGEYLNSHISPGFAGEAAIFAGETGASLLNYPALKGAQWVTHGIQAGSELLAGRMAESAVSRLGGTVSVKAQQMLADNAGKVGFLKAGAGVASFTGIQEALQQGTAQMSGVLTPNEQDYRIMDSVFNVASSGLVGGLLGLTAEKVTGKLVDKSFVYEARPKKEPRPKSTTTMPGSGTLYSGFDPTLIAPMLRKTAEVVKAFFQSSKEATERQTMDNNSQAFEAGKEPNNEFLHEVNRHEAWTRLQGYLQESGLSKDAFIESLRSGNEDLVNLLDSENPDFEALQQLAMHESLAELAGKTEAEVMPSDTAKASFLKSMKDNHIELEGESKPYVDLNDVEQGEPVDKLQKRIDAFSNEEMEVLGENKANTFARNAIKRKGLLEFEKPLTDFVSEFGNQIASELQSGVEFNADYLKRFFDFLAPDGLEGLEGLLDANKTDIDFMLDTMRNLFEDMQKASPDGLLNLTPEQIQESIKRQFEYVKAQVIRSQRDAVAFDMKLNILKNSVKALGKGDGQGINQGINALLDRSLFQFEGANSGTYRKMNIQEQKFKTQLTLELDQAGVMEFWNDTNSSTEIAKAIYNKQMELPMDEISEAGRKVADIIDRFYSKAIDLFAKEGVLIPILKGRIHYQWHNPYKILKTSWRERLKFSRSERRDMAFDKWYDFIKDKIDLEKTFKVDPTLVDEPALDINNPEQLKAAFRNTFDKIVERDFRREKTNLLNKRSKQRVYQFKSPEDFAAYNRVYGAGDSQSSIIRELNGMFREVELVKDWGVEPEKMLADVLKHAESLPGWKEYALRDDMETPKRLMHLMRFGAAHTGSTFSEAIYNIKAYESVSKLGNLVFLNFSDSLTAANALNRVSIPMRESIVKGIQETFKRYTPEQKADYQRMFNISKEQYLGGYYRHFEDGTLSANLSKMIRLTMKITGTENSEYSNRSMVGQSLSNWMATNMRKFSKFESIDERSRFTLGRYDIGAREWRLLRKAIRKYKDSEYIGWDTVQELTDEQITTYLKSKGVKNITPDRIEITRDDIADRYRLLMQDQMDDALNRKSLIETDLLRFKRPAETATVIDDLINGMMLFKTYGFMWIRRHVGDRIYGRGAQGYRTSQIQGTADWQGLMKLMGYSFAMEYAINQMKSIAGTGKPQSLDSDSAMDALLGSLGPISYVTRLDGSNLTSSIMRILGGPIAGDADKVARIVSGFEKGYWKGDYTNAKVNSIKFLADQFGGVPMLKTALNTLFFDNMIQNIKGRRTGHVIDQAAANQPEQ